MPGEIYERYDFETALANHFGEEYLTYRKLWKEYENEGKLVKKGPLTLELEIINACNKSCIMCPRNSETIKNNFSLGTKEKMSLETLKKITKQAVEIGTKAFVFAYGESLLHPELFQMIKFAKNSGILDIFLATNGLLLSEKNFDQIINSGITRLHVSIDATTEKTYQKIRGKGFNHVVRTLEKFLTYRNNLKTFLPIVKVTFVELPENITEKNSFLEYWKNKADIVYFQKYINQSNNIIKDYSLSIPKKFQCVYPNLLLTIRANGRIEPCASFWGEKINLGNINNISLSEAWNSPDIAKIRKALIDDSIEICAACQRM